MSYARFQVYRDNNGKYRFLLRDPQNRVITVSEPCDTKDECIEDLKAIKQYHSAPIEDLVKTEPRPPQKPREASMIRPTMYPSLILHDPTQAWEHEYVIRGADVIFRGQLRVGDQGIAGALINVYDSDRSFLRDDVLVSGIHIA